MSKYDFALDMNTDNSNSLILRNIKPNTKVLEIGPAHGRMTKYLKEQLNCDVYIVEYDKDAGDVAKQYATMSWIGPEFGNIERLHWFKDLQDSKVLFDYIIFADVLEHLKTPMETLKLVTQLLKDDGSILISIPNIGYNGLLIDLLQDKFQYRDSGILDRTHLTFFTYNSLRDFVASASLTVVKEHNVINTIGNSEFANSYNQVPKEVGEYIKKRKYGEVYQFIWELKKAEVEISIIIPVHNKVNFTISALKDLSHLDAAKIEIIIVDNASSDGTQEKLQALQKTMPNLVYLRNEVNLGFGAAVNKAFKHSDGNIVLFLNNDIKVKNNYSNWVNILCNNLNENNLISPTGGFVDPKNNYEFVYETSDNSKFINYLSGWCLAGLRSTFERLILENEIGPFDASTFFAFYEDTDLSFRATNQNIELKIAPVDVVHFGHVTAKSLNLNKLYSESKARFLRKWKK